MSGGPLEGGGEGVGMVARRVPEGETVTEGEVVTELAPC